MLNEAKIGKFTVAGQVTDEELADLPGAGYGTVVCTRPPEELDEPEAPKAEAAGLNYIEVGFTGATLSPEHIRQIRESVEAAPPGKVLIH